MGGEAFELTQVARVASPCVNLCTIDPATGRCLGCRRTIDEIAAWSSVGDAERSAILARLLTRG